MKSLRNFIVLPLSLLAINSCWAADTVPEFIEADLDSSKHVSFWDIYENSYFYLITVAGMEELKPIEQKDEVKKAAGLVMAVAKLPKKEVKGFVVASPEALVFTKGTPKKESVEFSIAHQNFIFRKSIDKSDGCKNVWEILPAADPSNPITSAVGPCNP